MLAQRMMWIAWPAFLAAALIEFVVFAFVDPAEFHWHGNPLEFSRQAIYTVSFFVFWLITGVASGLTVLLSCSADEINRCPVPPGQRPGDCARHAGC